jgi:hypothetical protein
MEMMKATTRRLAQQVRQAFLDLPEMVLLETIDQWLVDLDELDGESYGRTDPYYLFFGYLVLSDATGRSYASFEALEEDEAQAETCWVLPAEPELRKILAGARPTQIYHNLVGLAGDTLRHKAFTVNWGEPPGGRNGYPFIYALLRYLVLRREAGSIPTAQFEELYAEQLKACAASGGSGSAGALAPPLGIPTFEERSWHFRVTFSLPSPGRQFRNLQQALRQYGCLLIEPPPENGIEGYLSYEPRCQSDLKTLACVQRLLKRWQRGGWISVIYWKGKPPGSTPGRQKRGRRRRASRAS